MNFLSLQISLLMVIAGQAYNPPPPKTVNVTLAWNAPRLDWWSGCNLYYGNAPGNYTNMINAGNSCCLTVSNLVADARYYFAVTYYNHNGLESAFGNEVSFMAGKE